MRRLLTLASFLVLSTLVSHALAKSAKKKSFEYGPTSDWGTYPTNLFEDHVPKMQNFRPLIGVVAMEVNGQKLIVDVPITRSQDYFGSSFVKLVEAAGGRAVPVLEDISDADLVTLMSKINGLILPGGDADISDSGYARIAKMAVKYSMQQAKKNITFPILGICRGTQMMMMGVAGSDFLIETDALNLSIPLTFTKEAKHSRFFGNAPKGLLRGLAEKPITFNAHAWGIPTDSYYNNTKLKKAFRVISTNYDRNGTEFISTYEGRDAPLYGLQWHPEKVLFVYNPSLAVDHGMVSTLASQYVANFFVLEARKSPNRFTSRREEEDHLVFKHYPTYVGNITETPYEQIYLFDFDTDVITEKEDASKMEESEDEFEEKENKDKKLSLKKKKKSEEKSANKKEIIINADKADNKEEEEEEVAEESGDEAPRLIKISRNFRKDSYPDSL